MGQDRVTSKSAMNVTPSRRGYMKSSLQRSCYMERQSGEGRTPAVLNPLALAYHFGQATSTPDGPEEMAQPMVECPRVKRGVLLPARSRPSVITRRLPQKAVEDNGAESDGADNIILDGSATPSFGDMRWVYSKKKIETCTKGLKPLRVFFQIGHKYC